MASQLIIEFAKVGSPAIYTGKVVDGKVSLLNHTEPNFSELQCNLSLQSWPSFSFDEPTNLFVYVKVGTRVVRTKHFLTKQLVIRKGPNHHTLSAKVEKLNLQNYFGRIHEEST